MGALPVIVEDEVLVGGNCGVYEGAIVGRRAVLGSGVILTGSVTVYDVPRKTTYRRNGDAAAADPRRRGGGPGLAPAARTPSRRSTASRCYTPVIVKYRDEKTDAAAALEEALRSIGVRRSADESCQDCGASGLLSDGLLSAGPRSRRSYRVRVHVMPDLFRNKSESSVHDSDWSRDESRSPLSGTQPARSSA